MSIEESQTSTKINKTGFTGDMLFFFWFLFCLLVVAIWTSPIWFTPGMTGVGDWDYFMHRYEVLRLTVIKFGQWPGYDPWNSGGIPFLGNPNLSIFSIKGLLVLVFGTYWGLRLGVLIYTFICLIGSWKLSGIWWKDRFIRLIFAFYITSNPALIYHLTPGHLNFHTFCFMPLLFYFLFRFNWDKWSGLKAAIVLGVAVNDSVAYMVQYGALILACIYGYLFVSSYKENSRALVRWIIIFIPVFLTLIFYRVVTVLQIALAYPRVLNWRTHYEYISLLKYYLYPYTKIAQVASCEWCASSTEVCSYVGIVAFIMLLLSFRQGFRWWHGIMILLVWAGIGNDSYFHIMYWIQKIPTFSSHLCFSRIRVFTLLFVGIAAISGVNNIWIKCKNHRFSFMRYVGLGIGIFMVAEVMLVSHLIMKSSHVKLTTWAGESYANKFQNISFLPRPVKSPENIVFDYRAIRMNLGWLHGYGEAYFPEETIRIGRDEQGYIGEYHQDGRVVEPVYWSPNRILLKGLKPNTLLVVNMNPGSPWYNNGKQLFPQYRIVEMRKPFKVMPDENGIVELTYRYPGQKLGIFGTIFWLIVSVVVVVLYKDWSEQSNTVEFS